METDIVVGIGIGLDDACQRCGIAVGHFCSWHDGSRHGSDGLVSAYPSRNDFGATEVVVVVHVEGEVVELAFLQMDGSHEGPVVGRRRPIFVRDVIDVGILRAVPEAILPRITVVVGIDEGEHRSTCLRVLKVLEIGRFDDLAKEQTVRFCREALNIAVPCSHLVVVVLHLLRFQRLLEGTLGLTFCHDHFVGIANDGVVHLRCVHVAGVDALRGSRPTEFHHTVVALGQLDASRSLRSIVAQELVNPHAGALACLVVSAHANAVQASLSNVEGIADIGIRRTASLAGKSELAHLTFVVLRSHIDAVAHLGSRDFFAGKRQLRHAEAGRTFERVAQEGQRERRGCSRCSLLGLWRGDEESHVLLAVGEGPNERGLTC